ncbi:prophage CP4-57 regulatory family protein [Yersinia rochesterensis]|uniref:Prophage CP4-57 regulatory family protein n=2 Tax=Yersinia TaxID=629 RepID=A0ABM5SQA0_9GAMM|nr:MULTISPECIES: AlpA family phage regulatory protein [Yersinia]AIN19926.1 prophage CP4-57 regulatory family protein [Yersinia rochesterensis]AJI87003.1 prophage CP4-57 regulatory family protein [Yersinia frederiksenii Y225]AJJ36764.1 prophage CP4-57 regulatory family protein [Yersinia rochesterensis]CNE71609.1 Predicted transcriptional regulator [Yersinia kristensenii]
MKAAIRKKKMLEIVQLSEDTINRLEKAGMFPKRFPLTNRTVAWNRDEVEAWLDLRQANPDEVEPNESMGPMFEKNPNHIKARKRAEQHARI